MNNLAGVLYDRTAPPTGTVPFVDRLADHGDRTAVITRHGELSYRELTRRVEDVARRLGTARRLVLVAGANELEPLVTYLGALAAGHPVLLTSGDNLGSLEAIIDAYDPDVVFHPVGDTWLLDERRELTDHDLHPDLALLLSTSGSTGSPKLVRLSHRNLQANAEAIAAYLGIRDTDRAATTLPMHYCYGLSVLHSHLLRGAGVVLTDRSVVDACFWDLVKDARVTTFAGVPHTFELLDRIGFDRMRLPHLRYVTQAGGRMAPDRVRRYAELGQRSGWDLVVMYGQTEATARMAYLPPEFAASHPHTIGVPIPGGSFRLDPVPDVDTPGVGELVYHGPNVMLGYAESPVDLGLGWTVDALRTGDLARRTADGLYEIIGRRSRFVKIFGLRIDLGRVEAMLAARGVTACCTDLDDELAIAVESGHDPGRIARMVATEYRLPPSAVRVRPVGELPRLATGKPDHPAVRTLLAGPAPTVPAQQSAAQPSSAQPPSAQSSPAEPSSSAHPAELRDELCDLYAELLEHPGVTEDDSFVSLGGDSLSYVAMSVRLEQALGHLPEGWHTTPIRELAATPCTRRGRFRLRRTLETSVALRAVAIILIAGSHIGLFTVRGGAYVLLAVAGFNFARFQLTPAMRRDRLRHQVASIARVAVPSMAWIAAAFALTGAYTLASVFLLNSLVGPEQRTPGSQYWFVEILVYILVLVVALMAIPWVDRMERRYPFRFVLVLLGFGLVTRYGVVDLGVLHTVPAFWLFALGWAIARASTARHRVLLTVLIVATVPGFFHNLGYKAIMIAGMALLLWAPGIACPPLISRVAGVLAGSSLYIYLTHWQVYPHLTDVQPLLALLASVAVGIAYWLLATRATAKVTSFVRTRRLSPL